MGLEPTTFCMAKARRASWGYVLLRADRFSIALGVSRVTRSNGSERGDPSITYQPVKARWRSAGPRPRTAQESRAITGRPCSPRTRLARG
jgi:hypothetical protein